MGWLEYLLLGIGSIGAVIATIVIVEMITESVLKKYVRKESQDAGKSLYAIIDEIQPKKVTLSHYDRNGNKHSTKTYESERGVSSSLRKGMRIEQY